MDFSLFNSNLPSGFGSYDITRMAKHHPDKTWVDYRNSSGTLVATTPFFYNTFPWVSQSNQDVKGLYPVRLIHSNITWSYLHCFGLRRYHKHCPYNCNRIIHSDFNAKKTYFKDVRAVLLPFRFVARIVFYWYTITKK